MESPETPVGIPVARCRSCHASFLDRTGPCPRCGRSELDHHRVPPEGIVLAATEILVPPTGFSAPHRLALIEATGEVRMLAIIDGELPEAGAIVDLARAGGAVRARPRIGAGS